MHPAAGPAAEWAAALTSDVFPMLPYVFDVVDVLVTEGPADVDGVVYPDAIEVELSLPVSWTAAVAAGAPEILDGRFIAEVWAWEHERPSLVFALRAVLNPYTHHYYPDLYVWALSSASVQYDATGGAHLTWSQPDAHLASRDWAARTGANLVVARGSRPDRHALTPSHGE